MITLHCGHLYKNNLILDDIKNVTKYMANIKL